MCPVEDTGKNSVIPWIAPKVIVCEVVIFTEFESANKKRNIITILGFTLLFFLLICFFGKPTGIDILWGLLISVCASLFYYFINFSIFISWLATKGMEEHNRLSSLDNDIKYLEKLYDEKE